MKQNNLAGLKMEDFRRLLKVPDNEVVGEIIRLNCTIYGNSLDVIRVSSIIKMRRKTAA
jgi:hypothetical protein